MDTYLRDARQAVISALATTLELQLRLLSSTESDPEVISRLHDSFCDILDRLGHHPSLPHIQQFSDLNRDEFVRAERDHLRQFRKGIDDQAAAVARVLRLDLAQFRPRYGVEELIERMLDTRRAGARNQFTEAQRVELLRTLDARQYYGARIADEFFVDSDVNAANPGDARRTADQADHATDGSDTTNAANDRATDDSLFRMKANVLTDAVRHYRTRHPEVLAVAILRLKRWLAGGSARVADGTSALGDVVADHVRTPVLRVVTASPRRLSFVWDSPSGTRAIFEWGIGNQDLHPVFSSVGLPRIASAGVSLVLTRSAGAQTGFSFVHAEDPERRSLDDLATLIKKLDFTDEYLRLVARPSVPEARAPEDDRESLMRLAEEL